MVIDNLLSNLYTNPDNLHLVLLKMYTLESFLSVRLNKYLREEDYVKLFKNLFLYFILLQHSLFLNFTDNYVVR